MWRAYFDHDDLLDSVWLETPYFFRLHWAKYDNYANDLLIYYKRNENLWRSDCVDAHSPNEHLHNQLRYQYWAPLCEVLAKRYPANDLSV